MRVERRLGDTLWEAVQPELGRRVALRRLREGEEFDAARWPEHPGVVRLYAVTEGDDGTYLILQLVPGARTLADCRRQRAGRRRRWVDEAGAIVAGAPHGRLTDHDILVAGDGRAWVTGFGRPAVEDDAAALARIRSAQSGPPLTAVVIAVLAVAAAVVVLAMRDEEPPPPPVPAPEVAAGAIAIGSALAPGRMDAVDCDGDAPSGASVTCTVMQLRLDGHPVAAPFAGVVRAWAVRGARGRMALQILRPVGDGFSRYNGTRVVTVEPSARASVFRSDRRVPKGARFGLELAPGAAVGIREGVEGAGTGRFFGLLRRPPEAPDTRAGGGEELLLRVDLVRDRQG